MYLVCKDNPKFKESGDLIKEAKKLGLYVSPDPVPDRFLNKEGSNPNFFLYGTRDYVLPFVNNPYHIFNSQEYLYDFSFLLSISEDELFNIDAEIMPASQFYKVKNGNYFVRPNSGNKQFNGQVVNSKNVKYFPSEFGVDPWELIIVAPAKKPHQEEYRFFCHIDNEEEIKLVGCRYLPTDSNDIPPLVLRWAKNEAEFIFENLTVGNSFVLDLGFNPEYEDEKPSGSVIELNSWNSSGYYSISPEELLKVLI